MGDMVKKHRLRVFSLEAELSRLEAVKKPSLRQQHRIARIRGKDLPKARRHFKS